MKHRLMGVAVALSVSLIAACGQATDTARDTAQSSAASITPEQAQTAELSSSQAATREVLFTELQRRAGTAASVSYAVDLADYLPSQRVSYEGQEPVPLAYGVVTGDITDAAVTFEGRIGDNPERSTDSSSPPPADVDWPLITATLSVSKAWVAADEPPRSLRFIVPIGGTVDPASAVEALESMRGAIVVLTFKDPSDQTAWRVAETDAALGFVDDAGGMSFPALTDEAETVFLQSVKTLDDVERAAQEEQPVIVVRRGAVQPD